MRRRDLLSLLALSPLGGGTVLGAGCRREPPPPATDDPPEAALDAPLDASLARGLAWLATQQAADGRFPSRTSGLMRGGHSLTPFVGLALHAVARHGDPTAVATAEPLLQAARSWCATALAQGPLGLSGPALDYPVYATSMALRLVAEGGLPLSPLGPVLTWLLAQQRSAADGWDEHPVLGGFEMGQPSDAPRRQPPNPGHVDLSMTRRAAQALVACRSLAPDAVDAALAALTGFVLRCHTADGGFVYSPGELALNKSALVAGRTPPPDEVAAFRGYGSATCDGVLALRAAGGSTAPARAAIDAGLAWLRAHPAVDRNPGLDDAPIPAYARAMRFYYRGAAAEVYSGQDDGPPGGRAAALAAVLLAEQQPDGSWANELALQKEDDPLVATGFALSALARVRRFLHRPG